MSKAFRGALVQYCGHNGYFTADIHEVGSVNVVRANGPVTPENITRPAKGATHLMVDMPVRGYWNPQLGVFVVPKKQVTKLER